ncbi:MAG TPA: galactosyldiacylglycerol synthase [Ruminococcaceae bacterium]|jgi:processive 1,2-diacylglycerol beta-glucosyltransferase|nr:galactosyldiacylglycerol synthase [Oscillospiraceae bacterium]HBQ46963.1 galactosyldiacylglycerol synthase [Oscillospiraceae bacterium]HBT90367.1 galactosyldiacylglycerol synthase [Oscillospiraceae bacterium]
MNILILSAATGGGHLRASRAICSYIEENCPDSRAEVVDALKSISGVLDKTVCNGYHILAMKTPKLFGQLYRATNRKSPLYDLMTRFSNTFSRMLLPAITARSPDAVIATHPFVSEMVSDLKAAGALNVPLITLMTDYGPHRAWIADRVDAYVVADAGMIPQMEAMGVPREKIYPFGIPVENVFFTRADRPALREKLGLARDLPTVLIMAGSFGVTNILGIYRRIVRADLAFQVVVITGRNRKLYAAFRNEVARSPKPTKLVFFTNEVENYMHASDLLITKPGGMTVSEALACSVPLAVFDAIPGQEEENADFLLTHNMAVRLKPGEDCGKTVLSLLEDSRRLDRMRSSCAEFDKSHSSEDILSLTRRLCGEYRAKQ